MSAVIALAFMLGGCAGDNFRDVEGVRSRDPDKIEVWNNVDQHPNVVLLCIHGVAFATTTRTENAIMRVPEWDRQCPGAASPSPSPAASPK